MGESVTSGKASHKYPIIPYMLDGLFKGPEDKIIEAEAEWACKQYYIYPLRSPLMAPCVATALEKDVQSSTGQAESSRHFLQAIGGILSAFVTIVVS